MAQAGFSRILIYKSDTATSIPVAGNLTNSATGAELAVNTADLRLFTKNSGGSVVELGTNPSSLTLPNGTANGVLYLNGSKVATSGSALTFDGTNLGIGTSSPLGTLGIAGSATTTIVIPRSSNGTTASPVETQLIGSTFTNGTFAAGMYALNSFTNNSGNWLAFKTTDTGNTTATRMTLDASGNLGLGVTPSAWDSTFKSFEIGAVGNSFAGQNAASQAAMSSNAYYNGGWKYARSTLASQFALAGGQAIWYTAPSGTAGNAITFTQAMTLDASGNLLVGATSSTLGRLEVVGGSGIRVNEDAAGTKVIMVRSAFAGGDPAINVTTNHPLTFLTNNTERARITAGGVLCVGGTNTDPSANAVNGIALTNDFLVSINRSNNYALDIGRNGTDGAVASFRRGATQVGTISVDATNTAYNTSSDRRLKENIVPADDAGLIIDAIKIVKHDWKVGGHTRFGVVAQDLHNVAPEAVKVGDNGDEVTDAWGVDYSKLVPMLVKEIQSLRARVAQLESK